MDSKKYYYFSECLCGKRTESVVFTVWSDGSTFDPSWEGEYITVKFHDGSIEYSNTGVTKVI